MSQIKDIQLDGNQNIIIIQDEEDSPVYVNSRPGLEKLLEEQSHRLEQILTILAEKEEAPLKQIAQKLFNIRQIGTANFYFYGERKISRHLTAPPQSPPPAFRGRQADYEDIKKKLSGNQHLLLLLNANGGIGKTTLASYFYLQEQSRFTHLAWIYCETGIAQAMLRILPPQLGIEIKVEKDTIDEALASLLAELANLKAECLLVLDNANDLKELKHFLPKFSGLKNIRVLVTSRCRKLGSIVVEKQIQPLNHTEAVELFATYYPPASQQPGLLASLLTIIGYNTLVIELLAKNLAEANKNKPQAYSLDQLCQDLAQKGLLELRKSKKLDNIEYLIAQGQERKAEEIIAAMYRVDTFQDELPEYERHVLLQFALLPAQAMPYSWLGDMLGISEESEDKFEEALTRLNQKGWLDFEGQVGEGSSYKISPVVQAVVLEAEKPTYSKVKNLFDFVYKKLNCDFIENTPTEVLKCCDYGISIFRYLNFYEKKKKKLAELAFRLSKINREFGSYDQAAKLVDEAIQMAESETDKIKYYIESALVSISQKKYDENLEVLLDQVKQLINRNVKNNLSLITQFHLTMYFFYWKRGEIEDAKEKLNELLNYPHLKVFSQLKTNTTNYSLLGDFEIKVVQHLLEIGKIELASRVIVNFIKVDNLTIKGITVKANEEIDELIKKNEAELESFIPLKDLVSLVYENVKVRILVKRGESKCAINILKNIINKVSNLYSNDHLYIGIYICKFANIYREYYNYLEKEISVNDIKAMLIKAKKIFEEHTIEELYKVNVDKLIDYFTDKK